MYKKTVTYTDFDGNERIEDLYFNLTKTELIDFALSLPDNVSDSMTENSDSMDTDKAVTKVLSAFRTKSIFKFLQDLILKSYGIRTDEGRRFAKTDSNGMPLANSFKETMAFEAIMDEFTTDDNAAAEFINRIIPKKIADNMPSSNNIGVIK